MLGIRKMKFGKDERGCFIVYNSTKNRNLRSLESSIRYFYLVDKHKHDKKKITKLVKRNAIKAIKDTRYKYIIGYDSRKQEHFCKLNLNEYGVSKYNITADTEYNLYLAIIDKLIINPLFFPPSNHKVGKIFKKME